MSRVAYLLIALVILAETDGLLFDTALAPAAPIACDDDYEYLPADRCQRSRTHAVRRELTPGDWPMRITDAVTRRHQSMAEAVPAAPLMACHLDSFTSLQC